MTMKSLKVLDVTLRDGGYRINFDFDPDYAVGHVRALRKSGVDWIEIGYRNGSFQKIAGIGLTGLSPNDYIRRLSPETDNNAIAVMVHPRNVSASDIAEIALCGAAMIRICVDRNDPAAAVDVAKAAKDHGLVVCMNLTRVTNTEMASILDLVALCQSADADVIYLADSNGNLTPRRTASLFRRVRQTVTTTLGFHAHDNLGLAMANSIAACAEGATYIDGSLRGMGKGTGNLKLELWASYLVTQGAIDPSSLAPLLDQVSRLEALYRASHPVQPIDDVILGLFDLPVDSRSRIMEGAMTPSQVFANARLQTEVSVSRHAEVAQ